MAIIPYKAEGISPDVATHLLEISDHSLQARSMLTALGDYWTAYYRDLVPVSLAASGSMAAVSKEYTRLLDLVRASNILDVPITDASQFELLVIDAADLRTVYTDEYRVGVACYEVDFPGVVDTAFLSTSLFEAPVVLERGRHFDVIPGKGYRFYVDLFGDRGIADYSYELDISGRKKILLWACDLALSSTVIYNRYGRFLYRKSNDGEQYKWFVSALMRFYANAKTTKSISDVLNIMYGVPYTRYRDETIVDSYYVNADLERGIIDEAPYICIETDKSKYYTYAFSKLTAKPGDTVPQFTLLATFNEVLDYVNAPGWWEHSIFPDALLDGNSGLGHEQKMELMDKVLKYNTVYVKIGVSFETYQTYLRQVREFHKIIESGFPVYLYPLVEPLFRAVFVDTEKAADGDNDMNADMVMASAYDYGHARRFDGVYHYYMDPHMAHGRDAVAVPIRFDGGQSYTCAPEKQLRHQETITGAAFLNGTIPYDTGWDLSHDNTSDILEILARHRTIEDTYSWDTSPYLDRYVVLTYSGMTHADGTYRFGENHMLFGNDILDGGHVSFGAYADACMPTHDNFRVTVTRRP